MPIVISKTTGTHSHANDLTEQTVFTISSTQNNIIKSIWFDVSNLAQNFVLRLKHQIDGTNYRTFEMIDSYLAVDDGVEGILVKGEIAIDDNLQATLQSSVLEGASREVPYKIIYEGLGTGAISFTYTLTDSVTGLAIDNCNIWVTSDASGNNVIADGVTNASGQITWYLDAGTIYIWREKAGYNFSDPDTETVA